MAFSILNNVSSMQAQQYLGASERFQSKTISRVTSGLRIVSSGDDAAGLAIANTLRSDINVLNQGIRNANDGLATLQTIDGGINNISQLLDRARTLAAQSASGTFSGSREVLNSEFSSVITEIDRQAQAIGLDTGGQFAKSLSVFVGGGRANGGTNAITNGSVSVNLTTATVDAKSLGLKGTQALGNTSVDIGTGNATTNVAAIVGDSTNVNSLKTPGFTEFKFRGPGFGDDNQVSVSVNLNGVTDTDTLVTAINAAIDSAGNGSTAAATAFKNSGVRASVNIGADGTKQLAFSSASTAFQVAAGDRMANALMGKISGGATGTAVTSTVTGGSSTAAGGTTFGASGAGTVQFRFQGAGLTSPVDISLSVVAGTTIEQGLASLTSAVASNSSLQAAGITVTTATAGSALVFTSNTGEKFEVSTSGDLNNRFGLGSFRSSGGASGTFDYTTITGSGGSFDAGATLEFSIGGGTGISLTLANPTNIAGAVAALNAQFTTNSNLSAAGLVASNSGGQLNIASSNGTAFRINTVGATNEWGFNAATATGVADVAETQGGATAANTVNAGGSYQTGLLTFSGIKNGSDDQTITFSANNANGSTQSLAVVLRNDGTARNARTIDEAINTINTALQQSNNDTLKKIVAFKENDGGTEKIRFSSSVPDFKVSVGTTGTGAGIGSQGTISTATLASGGATADISSQSNAQSAVTALGQATAALGKAQAVVGRGQNQFNFAVNLATSQVTNLAASESRIRDADLAQEAANLTKAQIQMQAGIAALSQANSAPQQILSLLR